jgi:glucokinase
MDYAIGIDLGGTNIKAVAVTEEGELLEQSTCATGADREGRWRENVREQIDLLEGHVGASARWKGMASPGLVAGDRRSIAMVSTWLPGLPGLDWTKFLESDRQVVIINDAHAALLGEVWKGAGLGCRHAILLTLGTGVGGAIYSDGRLLRGMTGKAGHLGHMCLDINGKIDGQGIPGSLEDAIGNATVADRTGGRFSSTRQLVEAHLEGEPFATEVWLRSVYYLACAMASLTNILDPEIFIIGGGISQAGSALLEPLTGYLEKMEWALPTYRARVTTATAGDFAGALGAAYNAIGADSEGE